MGAESNGVGLRGLHDSPETRQQPGGTMAQMMRYYSIHLGGGGPEPMSENGETKSANAHKGV